MAFISLKKEQQYNYMTVGALMFCLLIKNFLKMLFNKYKKDIVDFDDIEFNN